MNTDQPNKEQPAHCPRCAKKFECRPNDISSCDCSKIDLSKEEYRFVSARFRDCVCNSCLMELKEEYIKSSTYTRAKTFIDRKTGFSFIFFLFFTLVLSSQTYAPPVGQNGSTAVFMDSTVFVGWASGCTVERGLQDVSTPSLGDASVGDASMALGKAQSNGVVSLGDGGSAICTFDKPLMNGPGNDFAVFENGFDDIFLELAFVEVSSDGHNFFRFHAHSLTDTVTQTSGFGSTDATKINNLAGKYRSGYGTPFDLQELAGVAGLDINNVTHVKVIDVVGSINKTYASRDFYGNKINDPWPTPFPSGGFDLDAIGAIHQSTITSIKEFTKEAIQVYPNPINRNETITVRSSVVIEEIELIDLRGKSICRAYENTLSTGDIEAGIYILKVTSGANVSVQKILIH